MKNSNQIFLVACIMLVFAACKSEEDLATLEPELEATGVDEGIIIMPRNQVETAGISWKETLPASQDSELILYGEWILLPEHKSQVTARGSGRIVQVFYKLNQEVSQGAPLLRMESTHLADVQRNYSSLLSQQAYKEGEFNRVKALYESEATSTKIWEEIQSDMAQWHAEKLSYETLIRQYGIDPLKASSTDGFGRYNITAPITGRIVGSFVNLGQWLEPGSIACELATTDQVTALLRGYPRQIKGISPGDTIMISGAHDDQELAATVLRTDVVANATTQTIGVYCQPVNINTRDRPVAGAWIKGTWRTGGDADGIKLPVGAVRKETGRDFIFVHLPAKSTPEEFAFETVDVQVIRYEGEQVVVVFDSPKATPLLVVTEGAYYIDAQSKIHEFGEEE